MRRVLGCMAIACLLGCQGTDVPRPDGGSSGVSDSGSPGTPDSGTPDGGGTDSGTPDAGTTDGGRTLHYTANAIDDLAQIQALGFDMVDIAGSTANPADVKTTIDALPVGMRALVWVGNLDNTNCVTPGFTDAQFQAQVDVLAGDPKVFGYFLSDEPHPNTCTSAAADLRARADYVHAHAPGQKAFIVVLDGTNACGGTLGCEYAALNPTNSHVDLIGIDPYPCHMLPDGGAVPCDGSLIGGRVSAALDAGVPRTAIVPTFQTFGQEARLDGKAPYYRTPTTAELSDMIAQWHALVPTPVFDYAYTWGVQCTASTCPAPQALSNHSELQAVIQAHNAQ